MTLYELLGKALPYMTGAEVQCFWDNGYIDECAEAILDSEVGGFELVCDSREPDEHIWITDYDGIRDIAAAVWESEDTITGINVLISQLGTTDIPFSAQSNK